MLWSATTTPPRVTYSRIAAAFAEFERDRIAERQRDVKQDMKARGKYLGGYAPFGYRVKDGALVEVTKEQAAIQTMVTALSPAA